MPPCDGWQEAVFSIFLLEKNLCASDSAWTQKARPAKVLASLSFIDSWHRTPGENVGEKITYLGTQLQCICTQWLYCMSVTIICPLRLTTIRQHRQDFHIVIFFGTPLDPQPLQTFVTSLKETKLFQNYCEDPKLSKYFKSVMDMSVGWRNVLI